MDSTDRASTPQRGQRTHATKTPLKPWPAAAGILPVCIGATIGYLAGVWARDLWDAARIGPRRRFIRRLVPAPRKATR